MGRFYNKEQDDFNPRYGDIDWRAVLVAKLALEDEEITAEPIWFATEDGLDLQCTQENTDIYVSKASDDMDAVLVLDPRDEQRFTFFRSDIGDEVFDHISQSLQTVGAAAVHFSLYPRQEIAEVWVRQNTEDDLSGYVPDDWMQI
jgi:hypothetical protein